MADDPDRSAAGRRHVGASVMFRYGTDVLFGRASTADAAQKFVDEVKSNLKV